MKSLLSALQEGRLIELPENDKTKALEYLATLIEAIPHVGVEGGITEGVLAREQLHNTGIGKGWACPHTRSTSGGDLLCSVGWSPKGIDYGAPDSEPVHLVVMYFVPDSQKNSYLKEISLLAKAIQTIPAMQDLSSLGDLSDVRHRLLDAISIALESMTPDARARMIKLGVKQAAVEGAVTGLPEEIVRHITPVTVITGGGFKPLVLSQDATLVTLLESRANLAAQLDQGTLPEFEGVQILVKSSSRYQPDRVVYDCLAFRVARPGGHHEGSGG